MNKIKLIIAREYLTRVKKKSFIIMTLLAPILLAGLMLFPLIIAHNSSTDEQLRVLVVDDTEFFINELTDSKQATFTFRTGNIEDYKKEINAQNFDAILHIVKSDFALKCNLYYVENPPSRFVSNLESEMDKHLFDKLLMDTFNIEPQKFRSYKDLTQTHITSIIVDELGNEKQSFVEVSKIVGMITGFIIYFLIFLCASQVLRGVLEEKTNRIVEVLISSVKPMELLLGKIIGVAMVGLTQFLLWVCLTLFLLIGIQFFAPTLFMSDPEIMQSTMQLQGEMINTEILTQTTIFQQIDGYFQISFITLILCFLFFFIFGYLIYASLFAGVGSAVDNETDSQQFIMPVTLPLILSIMVVVPIAENPNGKLALWMSMIPLTSPIAMLVRIPSGVPLYQILISMGISIAFFLLCVWIAAKIYRIGILMYGKKVSYKDLWKWLRA